MAIQGVVVLGIAAFFAFESVRTESVILPNPGDIGKAALAVVSIVGAYDLLIWRWIPLPGRPPRLRGTYKMLLAPTQGQPEASLARKTCYLRIRQTASTVGAKLLFDDAESVATTALLTKSHGNRTLLLFYDFNPKSPSAASPRRKGAVALALADGELEGRYWNDVGTWGTLVSEGHTKKLHESFRAAAQGKYS